MRRKRLKIFIFIGFAVLLALVVGTLRFGPRLWPRAVASVGQHLDALLSHLSPAVKTVEFHADAPFDLRLARALVTIAPGEPLFFLPVTATLQRLLSLPMVRNVALRRSLDGRVGIFLTLRQPVALVAGGVTRFTDAEGNLFPLTALAPSADYPVITGLPAWETVTPERRLLLTNAINLLNTATPLFAERGHSVSEVHLDPSEGYALFTDQLGGRVVCGFPPFAEKLGRLRHILDKLPGRLGDIEMIDLDYNKRAFVRFKHLKHQGAQMFAQKGW